MCIIPCERGLGNPSEIEVMSVELFRVKVREAIPKTVFTYLCAEKEKLSKMKLVPHSDIKMEQYLQPSILEINQSKLLFSLRSRMLEVKVNFK